VRLLPRNLPIIDRLAPSPASMNRISRAAPDHRRPLRCNATATTMRIPTLIAIRRMVSGFIAAVEKHPGTVTAAVTRLLWSLLRQFC
jgi:hypothetical protein